MECHVFVVVMAYLRGLFSWSLPLARSTVPSFAGCGIPQCPEYCAAKKKLLCEGHEIQEPPPIKQNMGIRTMEKTKVPCGQAISQQKILVNEWPKPRHFLIQWLATETKYDKKKRLLRSESGAN